MELTTDEFLKLVKISGLQKKEIAELLSVTRATINNWERGGVIPKNKHSFIRDRFSSIAQKKETDAVWVDFESFMMTPLVTKRAYAGFLSGWGDDEYIDDLPKVPWEVDREYKGTYMTFEVSGDSMESDQNPRDSLYDGDLILCREIGRQHWKNKLHINKWDFVIVHKEKGIVVKRIVEHNTETGVLTLHSLNSFYEDYSVQMDDLIAIYNIVDMKRSRKRS